MPPKPVFLFSSDPEAVMEPEFEHPLMEQSRYWVPHIPPASETADKPTSLTQLSIWLELAE